MNLNTIKPKQIKVQYIVEGKRNHPTEYANMWRFIVVSYSYVGIIVSQSSLLPAAVS